MFEDSVFRVERFGFWVYVWKFKFGDHSDRFRLWDYVAARDGVMRRRSSRAAESESTPSLL